MPIFYQPEAAAVLILGILICIGRIVWVEKVSKGRWWRGLHEVEAVYVSFHDGSSDWLFKREAFDSQPVWATGIFKRRHWWNRYWHIDEATIVTTERWQKAQCDVENQPV